MCALTGFATPAASSDGFMLLQLDGHVVKWGKSNLNAPARITYAFVTSPLRDGSARNCKAVDRLDDLARRSGLKPEDIKREAEAAFRLWEDVAGVTFAEARSEEEADILIGQQMQPRGHAFANVRLKDQELATKPGGSNNSRGFGERALPEPLPPIDRDRPVTAIERSTICLNPERPWKIGFDGNADVYDLRYTFAHEIGHAIGLDHYRRDGNLMSFRYSEDFRTPQAGDAAGARTLYGPPLPLD
ncbi:matrixin family metalloprotease [Stappia sp. F7233]|uniref:Matrixin family metalloprotease n=1 Tax=Stappia albiluteola TaxID=2758565 RepID=A0A839AKX9_9HYPH|nr:matrixin family metalloprotease [Stappia albiluteola]MBA5779457.1 matrixin family metalloprotease [Stappia albiluteola]